MTPKQDPGEQGATRPRGPAPGVRPLAPVFISYRTSDGSDLATAVVWAPARGRRTGLARHN